MINFKDRIPEQAGRRKIKYEDGREEYVTVEMADSPVVEGTALNRGAMMALQGFQGQTTVFNADGSIRETNAAGDVKTTVFNSDGSISEIFVSGVQSITKTTTFNLDGSISEVVS